MTTTTPTFDPVAYKTTTRAQWEEAAEAWDRWGPTLEEWLGQATDAMLDAAGGGPGSRGLGAAGGAGGPGLGPARRTRGSGRGRGADPPPHNPAGAGRPAARGG